MTKRRFHQKIRLFMACEGNAEYAFGAWLQELCQRNAPQVHLDRRCMTGGDPMCLVEGALKIRQRSASQAGFPHVRSCLLIDTDRLEDGTDRSRDAIALAARECLTLIRQRPCMEAVLLRLYEGHTQDAPLSAADARRQLQRLWPDYDKRPTKVQIAARFSLLNLQRLASSDKEIATLLELIGLA